MASCPFCGSAYYNSMTLQCSGCSRKIVERRHCPNCGNIHTFTVNLGSFGCWGCQQVFDPLLEYDGYRNRPIYYNEPNRPTYYDEPHRPTYYDEPYRRRYDKKESKTQKSGCFIATAAFGTPMAKEIDVLRKWRDKVLLNIPFGKGIVNFYYEVSPGIASHISGSSPRRYMVRCILQPIIALIVKLS